MFVNVYKPPLGVYNNQVVSGDFNLEPTNPVMMNFMISQNFINLIKNNTCFKGTGSCIDLILTNRKYCFKNTSSYETGISDHHHLILSIMKTIFALQEPKKFVYRNYKTFSRESFKNDLKSDSHLPKNFLFICFYESLLIMMKNAFSFILKALFVLKIFKFLS